MKDNERDVKDFAIDRKFVVNSNVNIMNLKKADKDIKNTISAFPRKIRKKVNNVNKSIRNTIFAFLGEFKKGVGDASKDIRDTISDFLREIR